MNNNIKVYYKMSGRRIYLSGGKLTLNIHNRTLMHNKHKGRLTGEGLRKYGNNSYTRNLNNEEIVSKLNAHSTAPNKFVRDVQRKRPIRLFL